MRFAETSVPLTTYSSKLLVPQIIYNNEMQLTYEKTKKIVGSEQTYAEAVSLFLALGILICCLTNENICNGHNYSQYEQYDNACLNFHVMDVH